MSRITLRESSHPLVMTLPYTVAVSLAELGVAAVRPLTHNQWSIESVRKVGVVRIGDTQIEILPKMPVKRLFFLMGYSPNDDFWQSHDVDLDQDRDLLASIVEPFLRQARRAIMRGAVQGYSERHESSNVVRGKVDIATQLASRGGLALPVNVLYDEYSTEVAENRLVVSAIQKLLFVPLISARQRSQLRELLVRLDGVTPYPAGSSLPTIIFNRLNAHYKPVVDLALLVLRHSSIENRAGTTLVSGFLFDMWRIFESFISAETKHVLENRSGVVETQLTGWSLDEAQQINLRPDLVWMNGGQVVAAIDAKYKSLAPSNAPNADIYQMLAYCTRFGLTDGHLIYARGVNRPQSHRIVGSEVNIHCHSIELNQEPEELLSSVEEIGSRISHLSQAAEVHGRS